MMDSRKTKPLRLLQIVPNKVYNRLVVRHPFQTDSDYANAYQFAAKRLADTFAGKPEDDLILLPYLTLYRQAFELRLKSLIRTLVATRVSYVDGRTADLMQAADGDRLKRDLGHNLHRLLNELKKHYSSLDLEEPFPRDAEDFVLMLHEADPSGTAFRYAEELPEVQDRADFPDLAALFDQRFDLLSLIEDYVEGAYSMMPTLAEMADEYE